MVWGSMPDWKQSGLWKDEWFCRWRCPTTWRGWVEAFLGGLWRRLWLFDARVVMNGTAIVDQVLVQPKPRSILVLWASRIQGLVVVHCRRCSGGVEEMHSRRH
ncbi:hypothetical protein RchiOBHm_Chr5g0076321 [Rosa chinensis]|uniref:Uncharacterized protein n=1 Tax=Rosa chinensis TaxID=74649 RepID=A0A2P6QLP3_ROSCH|nr:hypothetical protein RchiOBHm_Chr5g0076321 [Rosa chinensis]